MRFPLRTIGAVFVSCLCFAGHAFASAYNAHPKLIVIVVIDQFRGDYLDRYADQLGEGGFRMLKEHGAYFPNCDYAYASTATAPGHATLLTGAYADGHGILANEWWDAHKKRMVTAVEDDGTKLVGIQSAGPGASPHNLQADTLGDELKLATQGKSRVFAISLKDRAAVLSAGFSGDGAYWIEPKSGLWLTSTYYRKDLPEWVRNFNDSKRAEKYLNQEWKDDQGNLLRTTKPAPGKPANFYELVGHTPLANDYEFEFARELMTYEKLGNGPATDLLVISLSANDILGHQVGPDSPEMQAMALALDKELAGFFDFLAHQIGLANVWIGLSADHGTAPLPSVAMQLHIPAAGVSSSKLRGELNRELSARLSPAHAADYVNNFSYPLAWLNEDAFAALHMKEDDAERAVGEALMQSGMRGYFTRAQLAKGEVPRSELGLRYEHSYSALPGWYVFAVPAPYTVGSETGTDHGSAYSYDTHVPLALYGIPFQPGLQRTHVEPVDLAVTLAALLGINAPSSATGRVLTEALAPARRGTGSTSSPETRPLPSGSPRGPSSEVHPAALVGNEDLLRRNLPGEALP